MLAIIILVSACIPIFYLWNHSNKALDLEVQSALLETAQTAALLVNGDLHTTFTHPSQEHDKNYIVQVGKLRRFMRQNPRLAALKTYIQRDANIHIILYTTGEGMGDNGMKSVSIMDVHENPSKEIFTVLHEHKPLVETAPSSNKWGTCISGYAPIYNSREEVIAAIGADISIEELTASKAAIRRAAVIGLGLAFFCSVGAGLGVYTLRHKTQAANREARSAQQARKAAEFRYQHLFKQKNSPLNERGVCISN